MESQKELIHKVDWDCLIILDACRYDFFEKTYKDFLDGDLKKADSGAYETRGWLKNTFSDSKMENTIYVSGTPHINSLGVRYMQNFDARNHFKGIVDVWDFGWDKEQDTVLPSTMTKAIKTRLAKNPELNIISHFNQPHNPYIGYPSIKATEETKFSQANEIKNFGSGEGILRLIREKVGIAVEKTIGKTRTKQIRSRLGLHKEGENPVRAFAKKYGTCILKEAYQKNLRIVLREIQSTIDKLSNLKIVITSDHGELLGEYGLYGHGFEVPELRKIPWLEVEN